jgi:hypothetical protein
VPTEPDFAGMQIFASTSNGFTPSAANMVYDGSDTTIDITGLTPNTTYYVRYAFYDDFDATVAGLNLSAQLSVLTDQVQTADIADDAVSDSDGTNAATAPICGTYTGSLAAPTYTEDLFTGAISVIPQYGGTPKIQFHWGATFYTHTTPRTQKPKMDRIEYEDAYYTDLGSCSIDLGTFGGYDCLVITATNTPADADVLAGSNTTAIVTIPGQPYLYVQSIDVPNKKLYCTPNDDASAGEAWLCGSGTFPATLNAKLWGKSAILGSTLVRATGSWLTGAASSYVAVAKTEWGNQAYGSYSEAFTVSCRAFLASTNDAVLDAFVTINLMKK